MDRSPDTVLALISGLDVVNNAAFLPGILAVAAGDEHPDCFFEGQPVKLMHYTRCNGYATACTAALGCPVPPMKANQQHDWLMSNEGQLAGWMHVDSETARQRAQGGYPTMAVWKNVHWRCSRCLKPAAGAGTCANCGGTTVLVEDHGHIALVVPADPTGPTGIYVSAAGQQNFVRCLLARSFGDIKPDYFTHN